MRTFHWVSGELTEVQRFINVPMRWCEQLPAREWRDGCSGLPPASP